MPRGHTITDVQPILEAFDGGERNGSVLEARFGIPRSSIYSVLRRNGRKLRTRGEANRDADKQAKAAEGKSRYWTPERRKAFGEAMRAGHAAAKALPSSGT